MTSDALIKTLGMLNRKERHHLLENVVGGPFVVSPSFRKKINNALKGRFAQTQIKRLPRRIPFVAMDYHLDWVWAALCETAYQDSNRDEYKVFGSVYVDQKELITGTQEDIDLLIAFSDSLRPSVTHMIFVEAKGESAWNNSQFENKISRLADIYTLNRKYHGPTIVPYLVLTSPRPPERLNTAILANWMRGKGQYVPIAWMKLERQSEDTAWRVERSSYNAQLHNYEEWDLKEAHGFRS